MLKGMLLDIDGTLVLSNDAHAHSWVDAFERFGYRVSFDAVRPLIGMGGDKLIRTVVPGLTDESGDGKKIKELRSKIFLDTYAAGVGPAQGARRLIEGLQAGGIKTIVASSSTQEELDALLKAGNLQDILTKSTTSDDADNSKPDPDIVQVALQKLGLAADEVLMLGDTPYDIASARKARIRCVAVRCGGWPDDGLAGAVQIYDDPAAVLEHLAELTAQV